MAQPRSDCVHLFPRRKAGSKGASPPAKGRAPILVSYQAIASYFGQPQNDAARKEARTKKAEPSANCGRCASDGSHCSAETIRAGESCDKNDDGRVMQTSDRHLDEVFSQSEVSDDSSDMEAAVDTMDVVASAIDEPQNEENEHYRDFDSSDLGWLVIPDYQETTFHEQEIAWWATVQEKYFMLRVASAELHMHNRSPNDTLCLRSAPV